MDLCFKVISADDEAEEPPIFAAPNEKELGRYSPPFSPPPTNHPSLLIMGGLGRWLQAFEGCISCMTPRSAEAYIRIERR